MWTKDNTEGFTVDELIVANNIAIAIIGDVDDGFDEGAIDAALNDAYVKGNSAEEWETRTRRLLWLPLAERTRVQA